MIVSRTPLRISFAGGGTDLPSYYRAYGGGAVTSAAIARYMYVVVNAKFDDSIRVAYSRTENVGRLEELQHELVREAMRVVGIPGALEVHTISDIPAEGTGLGSSSTLTVGLLAALYRYRGLAKAPADLAKEACEIEIDRLGGTLGKQDQYIAALGGLQYLEFRADDSVRAEPLGLAAPDRVALARHLSLFYTGITRKAQGILKVQDGRTGSNREQLNRLRALAEESRRAILARDYPGLGALLDEGWAAKRTLAGGITNPEIDAAYAAARAAGAWGGKITGAGGGGFLLVAHPAERSREIADALPGFQHLPVHFAPKGCEVWEVPE